MSGRGAVRAISLALALCLVFSSASFAADVFSITLEGAYAMAIKNSSELRIARLKHRAEEERLRLSAWTRMPSLDFSLSDSRTTRYEAQDAAAISASSTLSVPIAQGGRKRMQNQIDALSVDLEGISLSRGEDEVRDSCFSLFNQTRILRLKLEALDGLKAIVDRQREIAQREYELGKIREIDLVETETSVASLAQEAFSAETELMSAEHSLKKLLGVDQSVELRLVTDLDSGYRGHALGPSREKLQAIALARNQSVMESRFKVEEARLTNRIADSKWMPNVSLQGSFQLSGDRYPLQKPNYGLRATVEFPLELLPMSFSVGFTTSPDVEYGRSLSSSARTPDSLDAIVDRRLARISLAEAVDARETAERDAAFQLEEYALEYERLRAKQRLIGETLSLQARKVEIMRLQIELGQIKRVDYLEGENDLLNDRLDLLSGVLSLKEAEREIERLVGLSPGELAKYEDGPDEP
ncbi:MAG TPA: TolC family protein [Treponemataceae bacterium]|nr:TolC family protein [Treponemataceae bacterium]